MLFVHSDWLTRRWLAKLILFTSEQLAQEILKFPNASHTKKSFRSVNYSACVVYTKTIIHLSVTESDGYLPPLSWIIVKYTILAAKVTPFTYLLVTIYHVVLNKYTDTAIRYIFSKYFYQGPFSGFCSKFEQYIIYLQHINFLNTI